MLIREQMNLCLQYALAVSRGLERKAAHKLLGMLRRQYEVRDDEGCQVHVQRVLEGDFFIFG